METINQWFLTFLGNALWQPLVITAAALGCDRLMRNAPARQRHFLWVAALTLCVLIPLLGASGVLSGDVQGSALGRAISSRVASGHSNPTLSPFDLSDYFRTGLRTVSPPPTLAALALACYWLSLLFYGIKLWRAGRKTNALLAASNEREISERLALIKDQCQREFGLKGVTLLFSAEIAVPFTVGRRCIVLPEALLDSDAPELLSAAIGHEMAHIKRRDFTFNLIYELLSILLAFHPAVIFIKRRIKETRELACDELVTDRLLDAPAYARSLLQLADSAMVVNQPAYTLGVFEADILEERIMKLIERRPHVSKRSKTLILAAVFSVLTASSALAAVFSLDIEQSSKEHNSKKSPNEKIIGEWDVALDKGNGYEEGDGAQGPVLIVNTDGDRLTGKILSPGGGGSELALIEPRFDGEKFIIKAVDGKGGVIEGYVKLTNDQFEGPWSHTLQNGKGASGRMKLIRRG